MALAETARQFAGESAGLQGGLAANKPLIVTRSPGRPQRGQPAACKQASKKVCVIVLAPLPAPHPPGLMTSLSPANHVGWPVAAQPVQVLKTFHRQRYAFPGTQHVGLEDVVLELLWAFLPMDDAALPGGERRAARG